ncbi:hypothetical protein BC567DRAFT_42674 [Phyllosticta citribraziliensis]
MDFDDDSILLRARARTTTASLPPRLSSAQAPQRRDTRLRPSAAAPRHSPPSKRRSAETLALGQIKHHQPTPELLLQKLPFARLVSTYIPD